MLNETREADSAYRKDKDEAYERGYAQGKADAEPHWIPVTERTPRKRDHKDDMVLVCNENGSIRFNTCINGTWVYGDPIAWMPLPEPYKGVTE